MATRSRAQLENPPWTEPGGHSSWGQRVELNWASEHKTTWAWRGFMLLYVFSFQHSWTKSMGSLFLQHCTPTGRDHWVSQRDVKLLQEIVTQVSIQLLGKYIHICKWKNRLTLLPCPACPDSSFLSLLPWICAARCQGNSNVFLHTYFVMYKGLSSAKVSVLIRLSPLSSSSFVATASLTTLFQRETQKRACESVGSILYLT